MKYIIQNEVQIVYQSKRDFIEHAKEMEICGFTPMFECKCSYQNKNGGYLVKYRPELKKARIGIIKEEK